MIPVSENRAYLTELVTRAENLLSARGEFYTNGAKLALQDMLGRAKLALEGQGEPPFVRNREFIAPREEEEILFSTRRYTMVPPFAEEHAVFTHYGLEPALEWFENQDILISGAAKLPDKGNYVLEKAREFTANTLTGSGVGEYSPVAKEKLTLSMHELESALEKFNLTEGIEDLGKKIVEVYNRLRDFRHSRLLRTETEPGASLYLTGEGLAEMKAAIKDSQSIQYQYEQISQHAEYHTLEELKKAVAWIVEGTMNYDELNNHYYLWSSTDKIANFKVPEDAIRASLTFILPAEENESAGLGHVWIDDVEILSASGSSLEIKNGGFDNGSEAPLYWESRMLKGAPIMTWEERYPFCGGGPEIPEPVNPSSQVPSSREAGLSSRSLYICNPTAQDEGAWLYTEGFAVQQGMGCTLTFKAKIDGKLKKGLKAIIDFKDDAGCSVGYFEYYFNRKSSLPGGRFQLTMQCDAIQYALTEKREYAEKVKLAILYIMHDFAQGAEHWMVTNLRPEGSDSYGAVQGGRLLCAIAVSYSMIRGANVFSAEDKERFYALVEYLLRYMLDLRDRTEWTAYEAQLGCSNWQTDMCAGTGMMMMALPDFPNRHTWLNNANAVLKAQLELNVNLDGSWPESIRYHHAALERFAGYAKVLENVTGENWFKTTPLVRMFGFGVDMQTPGYVYFGGRIGTPPFGDHALGGGGEFGYFAGFLKEVAEQDRELGDRMHHTWTLAGRPYKKLWGEGILLENIVAQADRYKPKAPLRLGSVASYPDAGIYIFRNRYGSAEQSYFAIMSSPKPVAHGHLDQGSFVLYKNCIPLVMDSGIEGYFDSSTSWHISSYSHACLQFATQKQVIPQDSTGIINLSAGTYSLERGYADVPRSSKVLNVWHAEETESITIEIANPEGRGRHIRQVVYVKQPDLYLIRDHVLDFEGKVQFSLPVASRHSRIVESRVYSEGVYGIDLETVFLSPVESITLNQGRSTPFYSHCDVRDEVCMMDYIRAVADARNGFVTVLYPKERDQGRLKTQIMSDGTVCLAADHYEVRVKGAVAEGGQALTIEPDGIHITRL